MERTVRTWIAAVALASALLGAGGTIYAGEVQRGYIVSAPERLPAEFAPRAEIHPGQEFSDPKENNSSGSALLDAKPGQSGRFLTGVLDHVKGLSLGLLVGVGVGIGIIAVGALLAVGWPVLLAAAGFTALGGAIYGVFKGAQRFNVVECAVMSLISGVSGGLGNWLGTAGIAGRTLWMAKAGIDVLAGGLMQTTAYTFGTPHPTSRGAVAAFGIGAATAGVFLGAGFAFAKLKIALGFGGASGADLASGATSAAEQPVAGALVAESNAGALTRAESAVVLPARPGDVDALEELLPSLKSTLGKLPASVRTAFGDAVESLETAPNREQYIKELEKTAEWARRNPEQTESMIKAGLGLDDLASAAKHTTKLDSAKLARNMQRPVGQPRPNGYAAHHIVGGNDPKAEQARMILQRLGIDINDAYNGVFLPYRQGVGTTEAYHPSLHTEGYYTAVYEYLRDAANADEARDILQLIADELRAGTFPK